jgi:hypothetical protein
MALMICSPYWAVASLASRPCAYLPTLCVPAQRVVRSPVDSPQVDELGPAVHQLADFELAGVVRRDLADHQLRVTLHNHRHGDDLQRSKEESIERPDPC